MSLDKPGPQPMNAGITPGHSLDGVPIVESDSFADRLRKVEATIDRMRKWAETATRKMSEQDTLIRMHTQEIRRLTDLAADAGMEK